MAVHGLQPRNRGDRRLGGHRQPRCEPLIGLHRPRRTRDGFPTQPRRARLAPAAGSALPAAGADRSPPASGATQRTRGSRSALVPPSRPGLFRGPATFQPRQRGIHRPPPCLACNYAPRRGERACHRGGAGSHRSSPVSSPTGWSRWAIYRASKPYADALQELTRRHAAMPTTSAVRSFGTTSRCAHVAARSALQISTIAKL